MLKTKVGCLAIGYSEFSFTITLTGYPDHMCWSPDGSYITVLNDVCFFISWSQCVRRALFSWWTQSRAKCYTKSMWSIPLYSLFVSLLIAVVQRHIHDQRHALWCAFRFEGWYFIAFSLIFRPTASRCAHPVLRSKSRLWELQPGDSFRSCLTLQIPVGYGECVSMDIDRTQKQMCTASTDKFCYAMNLQCCCVSSRIRCP